MYFFLYYRPTLTHSPHVTCDEWEFFQKTRCFLFCQKTFEFWLNYHLSRIWSKKLLCTYLVNFVGIKSKDKGNGDVANGKILLDIAVMDYHCQKIRAAAKECVPFYDLLIVKR